MRGELMQSLRGTFDAPGPACADRSVEPRAMPDIASVPSNAAGELGFVLMGFPRLSETFITHEIHLLEQLGFRLRLFAV